MRQLICAVVLIGTVACTEEPSRQAVPDLESMSPTLTEETAEGFILKTGEVKRAERLFGGNISVR